MENLNGKPKFQAEELEQRMEMAKWFARTNNDPYNRIEGGVSVGI